MSPVDDTAPLADGDRDRERAEKPRHRASRAPRTPMPERSPSERRASFD